MHERGELRYQNIEYRGVDYSEDVWRYIHRDIKQFENQSRKIDFFYKDACELITTIERGNWDSEDLSYKPICDNLRALGYEIIEENKNEKK